MESEEDEIHLFNCLFVFYDIWNNLKNKCILNEKLIAENTKIL